MGAHPADRALSIVQLGWMKIAPAHQAIGEHERGYAVGREPVRDFATLFAALQHLVSAGWGYDHGSAGRRRAVRLEDCECGDVLRRISERAGRSTNPERHGLGRQLGAY